MDTIYITGHRNPDTDSIVSAMAYAALKNALGSFLEAIRWQEQAMGSYLIMSG